MMLKKQLGNELVESILASNEYSRCVEANSKMFDLVNLAKNDEVTAQEVDHGNFMRCKAKQMLQEKFFSQSNTEIKTGYGIYEENMIKDSAR